MKICLYKDPYFVDEFVERFEEIFILNNISYIVTDIDQTDFWDSVKACDVFIFRWRNDLGNHHDIAKTILPIIEFKLKKICLPNWDTCWHYDDKIRQYYMLKQAGFPIIESEVFWDMRKALEWVKACEFPYVFKLKSGAGSMNVVKVKSKNYARKLIRSMFSKKGVASYRVTQESLAKNIFSLPLVLKLLAINWRKKWKGINSTEIVNQKNYVYFQKFLPNNKFDTRITVIGDKAFGYRRMVRKNDFRASGSGLNDYDYKKIDDRCVKIAFEVSKYFKFQTMAYDFIYNENNDVQICEISYAYLDSYIYRCQGYWQEDLSFIREKIWPQIAQLHGVTKLKNLKQPDYAI